MARAEVGCGHLWDHAFNVQLRQKVRPDWKGAVPFKAKRVAQYKVVLVAMVRADWGEET